MIWERCKICNKKIKNNMYLKYKKGGVICISCYKKNELY